MSESKVNSLSILSYPDGFVFYYKNSEGIQDFKLKINAIIEFPDVFVNFIKSKEWISDNISTVKIFEHTDRFSILPLEIDDDQQIKSLFDFTHKSMDNEILFTSPLSDGKQIICYGINSERNECYKGLFPKFKLFSNSFTLTEWILSYSLEIAKPVFLAYLHKSSLQLFASNSSGLIFANIFKIRSTEDIVYFILRTLDQIGFNPIETVSFICGEYEKKEILNESLKPYLFNTIFSEYTPHLDNTITFR
jgi:hypothetical protein